MIVPTISRRRFVVCSSLAAATLTLRPAYSATRRATPPRVVFDPSVDVSVRFASAARQRGSDCHAMAGDPYRFVQGLLFASQPNAIAGICCYADFLVMTGTMQEARYRLVGHGLHPGHDAAPPDAHCCHGELSGCDHELRRQGEHWPEVLAAHVIASGSPNTLRKTGPASIPRHDTVATVSWLMKPRSEIR